MLALAGGGLEVEYTQVPNWRELVEAHFAVESYFAA